MIFLHISTTRLWVDGVEKEDKAVLLGHVSTSMLELYGAPDIIRLLNYTNLILERNLTRTVLSIVNG